MKFSALILLVLVLVAFGMGSCSDKDTNPNRQLSLDAYEEMDSAAFRIHSKRIREEVERLALMDDDSTLADSWVRGYYLDKGKLVWINRLGIDGRADTLLERLTDVTRMGFSLSKFCVPQIQRDLQRLRTLDFDDSTNSINCVAARLEYHLSKGFLRYAVGQRYGYVNPRFLLNHLDVLNRSNGRVSYRTLFDLPIERPTRAFLYRALDRVGERRLEAFLDSMQPHDKLLAQMQEELNNGSGRQWDRRLLLVNMERRRWRMDDTPQKHQKYILVNLPSYHLEAIDGDRVLSMRIGCGTLKTKTPLLQSMVERMDVNPQWIIPMSIVKESVAPHAGNRGYFRSRHYFIRERATGKVVDPALVGAGALMSGNYRVIQEGGAHNSLGRIIFRFKNDFSVYLHDTSSREVFSREDRGVSHGCVRVERPFDLGVFLLGDSTSLTVQKIRYSMMADVSPVGKKYEELPPEQKAVADTLKRKMLIGSVKVNPRVPIYIYYYTLYPDHDGVMRTYNDIYGYDDVIYRYLRNYMGS